MHIREATSADNEQLQHLQAKCTQGKTIIVTVVNTPDFFARAKAYTTYKVYVACEWDNIKSKIFTLTDIRIRGYFSVLRGN
jgi:hypothetical protein